MTRQGSCIQEYAGSKKGEGAKSGEGVSEEGRGFEGIIGLENTLYEFYRAVLGQF